MPGRWKVKSPYSLDRKLIRMSWNPNNLQNLLASKLPDLSRLTPHQQKFKAKKLLRAYHVPNINHNQFITRHFKSVLPVKLHTKKMREKLTPIQALTFGELERRVDVVVFRSHFAKSIWQARQMVVQGHVKINGVKNRHPCQVLNDGDMITVNPKVIPTLQPAPDSDGKQLEFKALPFMSPWMFIPTYLEVCYQTCSTVFLRAPLAQQQMEIPSPYPPSWHQLVFEYYASIKRKQTREPVKEVLNIQGNDVRLKPKFDKIVRGDLKANAEKIKHARRERLAAFVAREKSEYKKQGHSI